MNLTSDFSGGTCWDARQNWDTVASQEDVSSRVPPSTSLGRSTSYDGVRLFPRRRLDDGIRRTGSVARKIPYRRPSLKYGIPGYCDASSSFSWKQPNSDNGNKIAHGGCGIALATFLLFTKQEFVCVQFFRFRCSGMMLNTMTKIGLLFWKSEEYVTLDVSRTPPWFEVTATFV